MFSQKTFFWLLLAVFFMLCLYQLTPILPPFIAAFVIAYFCNPVVKTLEKYGFSRGIASALIVLLFVIIICLIIVSIIPMVTTQIANFVTEVPSYKEKITTMISDTLNNKLEFVDQWIIDKIKNLIEESTSSFFSYLLTLATSVVKSGATFVNILGLLFISPVIAFYALKDWQKILSTVDNLIPVQNRELIRHQFHNIDNVLYNYLCGQTYVCIFLSIFYSTGLAIIGLKYALFVGILTGILTLIPYVGVIIGVIIALIICYIQYGTLSHILYTLLVFALGQFIEGNFITPKIVGQKVGLHPIVMILAMFSGGLLIGFTGILFAIPIAAVIGVVVRFLVSLYKSSSFYR